MRFSRLVSHDHGPANAASLPDDAFARVLVVENELDTLRDAVDAETAELMHRARERAAGLTREAPAARAAALDQLDRDAERERAAAVAAVRAQLAEEARLFTTVTPTTIAALGRWVARRAMGIAP